MKKKESRMKFTVLICLLLFVSPMNASGKEELPATNEWEKQVWKGDRVPYDGILVPPDAYRIYQIDSRLYENCDDRIRAAAALCPNCDPWGTSRQWAFFGLGLVAGFLAAEKLQ